MKVGLRAAVTMQKRAKLLSEWLVYSQWKSMDRTNSLESNNVLEGSQREIPVWEIRRILLFYSVSTRNSVVAGYWKVTDKNVKFYIVATIRGEARNTFLPPPPGCWGSPNVRTPTAAQEKPEQEAANSRCRGQVGSGQGPGTAVGGTTAPKPLAVAHLTVVNSRGTELVDKHLLFVWDVLCSCRSRAVLAGGLLFLIRTFPVRQRCVHSTEPSLVMKLRVQQAAPRSRVV